MEECARLRCGKPAVALLTFAPQQAKAWLYDLTEPDPNGGIMLCRKHANATIVPMSWHLVDQRDPAWPGPASAEPEIGESIVGATPAEPAVVLTPVGSVASDFRDKGELTGLRGSLPVVTQPYGEPRVSTLRTAGVLTDHLSDADMSLFQLPLSDAPAVTPHPDFT